MTRVLRGGGVVWLLVICGACGNSKSPLTGGPPAPLPLGVVIFPPSVTATRQSTVFLKVTVTDSTGTAIVPDSVRWTSSDTSKATVSATGVLLTIAATFPTVTIQADAFKGRAQGSAKIPVAITSFP